MPFFQKEQELLTACCARKVSLQKVKAILTDGADANALSNGTPLLVKVILGQPEGPRQILPRIVQAFIDSGFNSRTYGLNCIRSLVFSTYSEAAFYSAKNILLAGVDGTDNDFENTLRTIGSEESYQRVCEENHKGEQLFYTMYEAVNMVWKGHSCADLEMYSSAAGLTVDQVVYFADKNTAAPAENGTAFFADIGLVCGEKVLLLRNSINVMVRGRAVLADAHICCPDLFGTQVTGKRIAAISFTHKTVTRNGTDYGQPTILVKFENGPTLAFTHNWGECKDNSCCSYFNVCS